MAKEFTEKEKIEAGQRFVGVPEELEFIGMKDEVEIVEAKEE